MGEFSISTTSTNGITGKITYSESNVSIANNTSDLTVSLIYNKSDSKLTTYGSGYFKITVNGVAYEDNKYTTFSSAGNYTVLTHTFTIAHDANGAKSVTITVNNGYVAGTTGLSASSGSGTAVLTTIARASTPSAAAGTFGSAMTINTNRASTSFTHTLTMSIGSHSESKTSVGASLSWTLPASWADAIPAATSGTLTISCVTYNGSTNIGAKSTTVTVSIPSSWAVSASISASTSNTGSNSEILKGVSSITLTASGTATTGSSISSYKWSGGSTATTASITPSTSTVGSTTYTCTVTDKRGKTASKSYTVTVVDPLSTFTCADSVNCGSALAVTITRKKSTFKHKVRYSVGSSTYHDEDGKDTSASWTIPTTWASQAPSSSSVNISVTVYTYNGSVSSSNLLGSKSKTVSMVIPSSWVPSISSLTATLVDGFGSLYLKGVSKVKLTASASASTGSSISSYAFSGNNISASGTATNQTSNILTVAGSNTFTVRVTDARGRTNTKTVSITVTDYSPPTIKPTVGRYDSGGTSDSFGEYGRIAVTGTWSAVTGNKWTVTLKYKKKTVTTYTTVNTYTDQTTASISKTSDLFAADVDAVYDCQATITDSVGKSATVNVALSTGKALLDLFKDKVVGFFSAASETLRNTFGDPSEVLFSNAENNIFNYRTFVPDKLSNDGLTNGWFRVNDLSSAVILGQMYQDKRTISSGDNLNNYIIPGTYFVRDNSAASNISNMPSSSAGTLYVQSTVGGPGGNNTWQYLHQTYVAYGNTFKKWVRYGESGSSTTFTWQAWKEVNQILDGVVSVSGTNVDLSKRPKAINTTLTFNGGYATYSNSSIGANDYIFLQEVYLSALGASMRHYVIQRSAGKVTIYARMITNGQSSLVADGTKICLNILICPP